MTATLERPGLRIAIELSNPVQGKLRSFVEANNRIRPLRTVQRHTHLGKSVAICGAGPSLRTQTIEGVDDIWACNSALPYLVAKGVKVTAGIGIDQSPGLLREWASVPDVPYMVASSCDPDLVRHLVGAGRSVSFFHNAVGFEGEFDLYDTTWPGTCLIGEGFSVTSRAIGVAMWMGYERVDVYGADCCFGPNDVAHANGEHITSAYVAPLIMTGETNGRTYRTRPDMLLDAVHLVRRVRGSEGRVRLCGDTLAVQLLGKPDAYLDLVARRLAPGETIPTS